MMPLMPITLRAAADACRYFADACLMRRRAMKALFSAHDAVAYMCLLLKGLLLITLGCHAADMFDENRRQKYGY